MAGTFWSFPAGPQPPLKPGVLYYPLGIIGTIWALLVAALFGVSAYLAYENHLFAIHGRKVTGGLINKWVEKHTGGRSGTSYSFYIRYDYRVTGGLIGTCSTTLPRGTWDLLEVGQTLPLVYLPEKPIDSRIDTPAQAAHYTMTAAVVFLFGAVILGLGGWGLGCQHGQNKIFLWLGESGARCQGTVASLVDVNTGKGGIRSYLAFRFVTNTGREITGRTGYLTWAQNRCWKENDPIRVFYNPARPEQFAADMTKTAFS
jgi:hypothetical protein